MAWHALASASATCCRTCHVVILWSRSDALKQLSMMLWMDKSEACNMCTCMSYIAVRLWRNTLTASAALPRFCKPGGPPPAISFSRVQPPEMYSVTSWYRQPFA